MFCNPKGCVVLLALAFLMPTFYFIPKAVLGAVIVTAVYTKLEYHEILPMWRTRSGRLLQHSQHLLSLSHSFFNRRN